MVADYHPGDLIELISSRKIVFWDFDGVIKESLEVKTDTYISLFTTYGESVVNKVRTHHESNFGVSRFKKIPVYMEWAGVPRDEKSIGNFCRSYSERVVDAVVSANWVPGVRDYLLNFSNKQIFALVTATPQREIELLLERLEIRHCFKDVFGAPREKDVSISTMLEKQGIPAAEALMIGDSEADFRAAEVNQVPFLLRETEYNRPLQGKHMGKKFRDLV